jgi:AcrR family transcriptional regulator
LPNGEIWGFLGLDEGVPKHFHPTKTKLVDTTVELLQTMPAEEISVDLVLSISKVSKGSMYHHFVDLSDLLETAITERYAKWVDRSIEVMSQILTEGSSSEEIYQGLVKVTRQTQSPKQRGERMQRVQAIAKTNGNSRLTQMLSAEQERLTEALTDIIFESQQQGFVNKDIDPRSLAVFIQSYTIGKIVDDFSESPVQEENWNNLINLFTRNVVIAKEE